MELNFNNKVVVVTGAGNGLGKSHAIGFAARGAKVVVNDLGGNGSALNADATVAEIRAKGGEAVANGDSVTDGHRIVEQALDQYGRIDVLINNAGILRDASFHKMTEKAWDDVYQTHLLGAYRTTQAAWPHMRDQRSGRVIMTASASGIYGNFGQANYSAVKSGLIGLGRTLAVEGAARGIFVNTIAPIAASKMTENLLPEAVLARLQPEFVTPLALLLCHESSTENGSLFEVGGGWVSKIRWEQSRGASFGIDEISPEQLQNSWDEITSFENSTHPTSAKDTMNTISEIAGVSMALTRS